MKELADAMNCNSNCFQIHSISWRQELHRNSNLYFSANFCSHNPKTFRDVGRVPDLRCPTAIFFPKRPSSFGSHSHRMRSTSQYKKRPHSEIHCCERECSHRLHQDQRICRKRGGWGSCGPVSSGCCRRATYPLQIRHQ